MSLTQKQEQIKDQILNETNKLIILHGDIGKSYLMNYLVQNHNAKFITEDIQYNDCLDDESVKYLIINVENPSKLPERYQVYREFVKQSKKNLILVLASLPSFDFADSLFLKL